MDFIIGLPTSRDPITSASYKAILVIVYQLIKAIEIILFNNKYIVT